MRLDAVTPAKAGIQGFLFAAKLALGPILLPQAHWVRRVALRLPEAPGPRDGVAGEGDVALRILVVGDSSAAGVGVADQAQALALPLAKELASRIGAAVAWQLIAQTGVNTEEAIALLERSHAQPADVVITILGVNDVSSQTSPAGFIARTEMLCAIAKQRTGCRWVVHCGLPPMQHLPALPHPLRWYLGRYAARLDGALREFARQRGHGYSAAEFPPEVAALADDGFHPGAALYPVWAARLADIVAGGRAKWMQA